MRRIAVGLVALVGCAFRGSARPGDGGPDDAAPVDGSGDGSTDGSADARVDATPDARSPFCDPTDPDLVACYAFENTATDGSKYGNNATTTTAATYVTGHDGLALKSTGATDIHIKDSPSLDVTAAITIELWVNPHTIADIWLVDNDSQYGLHLTGTGSLDCAIASLGSAGGGSIPKDMWTHVACTYDGAMNRAWINGMQVGSVAITGPMATSSTVGMAIGHDSPTGPKLDGMIDSVRIWRIARTPAQIACVANGTC